MSTRASIATAYLRAEVEAMRAALTRASKVRASEPDLIVGFARACGILEATIEAAADRLDEELTRLPTPDAGTLASRRRGNAAAARMQASFDAELLAGDQAKTEASHG